MERNGDFGCNVAAFGRSSASRSSPSAAASAAELAKDVAQVTIELESATPRSTATKHLLDIEWERATAGPSARATRSTHLFIGRPKLIVHFAFLRIVQRLVSLLNFLEFLLGSCVIRIHVRVVLARELAIRLLNFIS